jgi:hypothetical protein
MARDMLFLRAMSTSSKKDIIGSALVVLLTASVILILFLAD